ncbi:MAG: hypothetical protein PWP27_1633 [Clostridiales bacterium]|nr:hypothetical protein [Caldanaerobacter sp.]MDK2933823.1 hypothetical protein [Clostridiales bacterium]
MPRLLPSQLDIKGSQIFESKVRSLGIDIITDVSVQAFEGNEQIDSIRLKNGHILPTSFVIIAAGVRPNISFLQNTDIIINKKIVVDQYMKTNIDNIYAVGDVAAFGGKWYGLWSTALQQGMIAGANAAGDNVEYIPEIPPYFLNSMDTKVISFGDIGTNTSVFYEIAAFIDEKNYIYQKLIFQNNILVGAILIGDTSSSNKISTAIKNRMLKEDALNAKLIRL